MLTKLLFNFAGLFFSRQKIVGTPKP